MVNLEVLLLLYLVAGFALKSGDDLLDELHRDALSWLPLALSGLLLGSAAASSEWDLALVVSILIGVSATGKVNRPQFLVGFVLIAVVLLVQGVPVVLDCFRWGALVLMLVVASALDERGNDRVDSGSVFRLAVIFKYRFTLKTAVLLFSVLWPEFLLTAIGLWSFDIGYETASLLRKHLFSQSGGKPDCSTHP